MIVLIDFDTFFTFLPLLLSICNLFLKISWCDILRFLQTKSVNLDVDEKKWSLFNSKT